ncbi:MAG: DMT family transporter [Proteobacteria bacterium]|nr:DMT family transporter [Burkholderiales bacterium]
MLRRALRGSAGTPRCAGVTSTRVDGRAWIASGLLALAVASWAGNWVIGRMIRFDAPPAGITFLRWAISAVILLVYSRRSIVQHWALLRRSWGVLLVLALLASVLQHLPVYIGLRTTTATTASLLNATTPVFILLIAWLVIGEKLTKAVLAGVVIALSGALWIVTRGHPEAVAGWTLNVGDMWILLGTVSLAFYTICLRWRPPGLPAATLLCAISTLGALCALPLAAAEFASGARFVWSSQLLAAVVYISVGATVLAYFCWNKGVQILGASRAGPFMYLMPVYTPLMGWLWLDEAVETFHLFGIALIFAGILLTRFTAHGARARESAPDAPA